MSEPSGFQDSGHGNGRRDHHIGLNDTERAKLDAIKAELQPHERAVRLHRMNDGLILGDSDGDQLDPFTKEEIHAFVDGVKRGEFDDMVTQTSEGE